MAKNRLISGAIVVTILKLLFEGNLAYAVPLKGDSESQNENLSFEDKSFNKYTRHLLTNYNNKNYFAAIYQNDKVRDDFAKFLNEGLTQQIKDDLAGLRFYKKAGDTEVPVIMFSPQMDAWLGILPQWKRTKRFMFKKIEEYLSIHPEVLSQYENSLVTHSTN